MQDYIALAEKNGIVLLGKGKCQFCGANTTRGIHECVEIFSLGFELIDYSNLDNHLYRFLSVDAHTLQHPEIHGRWSNHFHLARQHLMLEYKIKWSYALSPKLSDYLNGYKTDKQGEFLETPKIGERGKITTTDVLANSKKESECQKMIAKWGMAVYNSWSNQHELIDKIASGFVNTYKSVLVKH